MCVYSCEHVSFVDSISGPAWYSLPHLLTQLHCLEILGSYGLEGTKLQHLLWDLEDQGRGTLVTWSSFYHV